MTDPASGDSNPAAPTVDITRPSVARVYDLFLGGRTSFVAADLTDTAAVLAHPAVTAAFDLTRPIALVEALVLHHIQDTDNARDIVAAYVDALPSGSYLAISHASNPRDGSETAEVATAIEEKFKASFQSLSFRTPEEIASLFAGLDLVEPGVVRLADWWPPGSEPDDDYSAEGLRPDVSRMVYGGLARKP